METFNSKEKVVWKSVWFPPKRSNVGQVCSSQLWSKLFLQFGKLHVAQELNNSLLLPSQATEAGTLIWTDVHWAVSVAHHNYEFVSFGWSWRRVHGGDCRSTRLTQAVLAWLHALSARQWQWWTGWMSWHPSWYILMRFIQSQTSHLIRQQYLYANVEHKSTTRFSTVSTVYFTLRYPKVPPRPRQLWHLMH